uniref:Peptidase C14 caspase domain-containing protein n=1 Tax=Chloropicon laureae TaxID=464258 RepID=A0A7S2YVB8_9CHLO|mmetsp:Transcript_10806/g.27750  ORF Transcript_10806/g.27750 Transcript_10806/m.27750 type:complete len:384 (+) Transcript_10806:32-1183(+)
MASMESDAVLLRLAEDPNRLIGMSEAELRRLVVLKGISDNPFAMEKKEMIGLLLKHGGSSGVAPPLQQQGFAAPSASPSRGKKRALLIGINYRGTRSELRGCITDTQYMHYCLVKRFGFKRDDILMLNEDQRNPYQIPTKQNIFRAIEWLMTGLQSGDSIVFMYSGHGDQVRDRTGEEIDGLCETLLPLDHTRAGPIVDKELYQLLIRPLGPGTRLFALCDSCHSGTILDLPYAFVPESQQTTWNSSPWQAASRVFKGTSGGSAVCISGCRDDQTSADTRALSGGQASTGAMLYSFIQSVENGRASTYGELIISMRQTIEHALKHGFDWGTLAHAGVQSMIFGPTIGMLSAAPALASAFTGGNVQVPQLSSDKQFNLRAPFTL